MSSAPTLHTQHHTKHETEGELPTKAYNSIYLRFPELPVDKGQREDALLQADSFLNSLLNTLDSFTVFYNAVPSSAEPRLSQHPSSQHPEQYEMDEQYPVNMHIDLKRDLESHIRRASNKSSSVNPQANLALFEKYQFLSSGMSCPPHSSPQDTHLITHSRHLHGRRRQHPALLHPLRRNQRHCRPRGLLHGLQQGDGSRRSKEAAAAVISATCHHHPQSKAMPLLFIFTNSCRCNTRFSFPIPISCTCLTISS